MLVGHENTATGEVQVTHSNFNYARHQTNSVKGEAEAYMYVPPLPCEQLNVILYGNADMGNYVVQNGDNDTVSFDGVSSLEFPPHAQRLVFRKKRRRYSGKNCYRDYRW